MANKYSIESIKRTLPYVKLKWQGHIYVAKVSGRKNRFASVTPEYDSKGKSVRGMPTWQFSWTAVAKAASDNTFLTV